MIYTFIPYSIEKNLGKAYNQCLDLLPNDNDFAVLLDHDACFTTYNWYKQLNGITNKYTECGCFVSMTNRIGCEWQRLYTPDSENWNNNDIYTHRIAGAELYANYYDDIKDVSKVDRGKVLGGVMILIKKSIWKKVGGFKEKGILGIDNQLHWDLMDIDEKVYLMKGVYLYHFYRGETNDKSHLL